MSLMGNPMDLEILSGLDSMDNGYGGYGAGVADEYMNMLAGGGYDYTDMMSGHLAGGYDPYEELRQQQQLAAIMGVNWGHVFNPLYHVKKVGQGLGRGISNIAHGRRPWAPLGGAAAVAGAAALAQQRQAQLAAQAAQSQFAQPTPVQALVAPIAGASARGTKVQPLGFNNGTFTATSGTQLTIRARPQRPLRGGRLVGSFARAGATANGLLTLVSLFVGTDGQLLSGDPISFDALSPNAFGVGVNLTPAAVGQEITAVVAVSAAPTMTDTIAFNLTLFGYSIG
jgi:hypothetical protein